MSSSSENREMFPFGSISGLFYLPSSALVLMDYDEERPLRLLTMGPFEVKLVTQTISPILLAVCSVDGFEWPLTKDSAIIRMNRRSFAIAVPGVFYGLQFLDPGRETHIDILEERVFMKYGHYMNLNDTSVGYLYDDNDPLFWLKLRPVVQPIAHEMLSPFGHQPGKSRFYFPNENCCYKRAVRLSATTKMITKGMTSGTLKSRHITIRGTKRAHELMAGSSSGSSNITLTPAQASVSVFVCLIDSVEVAWMLANDLSDLIMGTQPPLQTYPCPGFRVWRLNELGFVAFYHNLADYVEGELEIMRQKEISRANKARQLADASAEALALARSRARAKGKDKRKGK